MANKNLTYTVDADVKGYQEGMEEAVYSTDKAEAAIQDLIKSTPALKKSLRDANKEAQNLAAAFAQLSDEEKRSAPGRQLAQDLQLAMEKAAELQDVMNDTSTAIRNLSSDTQTLDALNDGFSAMGSTVSGVLGVIGTLTGKQEDFNRAIAAYTTVESAANAVNKLRNMFQKESNVMLAIGRVQTAALTKAQELQTAATGKATIAQKAFNAVAKANPYVLLATAVAAVGAALLTFALNSKKAEDAQDKTTKAVTEYQEALESVNNTYSNKLASTLGDLMTRYIKLQTTYRSLKTDMEKKGFIKEYANELKNVVGSVNSVRDADQKLVDDTDKVKEAFIERAKAAALYAKLQDLITKKAEAELKAEKQASKNNFKEGDSVQGSDVERYNLVEGEDYTRGKNEIGSGRYTAKGAAKAMIESQKKAVATAGKEYDEEINNTVELIRRSNSNLADSFSGGSGSGSKGGSSKNQPLTQLQKLQAEVNKYQRQLEDIDPGATDFSEQVKNVTDKLNDAKNKLKNYKIAIGMEIVEPAEEGSLEWFDNKISELTKEQKKVKIGSEGWKELQDKIDYFNRQKIEITATVNSEKIKAEADKILQDALKDVNPKVDIDTNFLNEDQQNSLTIIQNRISAYEQAKSKFEEVLANPNIDTTTYDIYNEKLRQTNELLAEQYEKETELANISSSKKKEVKTAEDKAEAYDQYASMLSSTSNALNALGDSEAAQAAQFAVNTAATIASTISEIAALQAKAMAGATASAASLPFPANLAAIASVIAAITSIFASLPSFAGGGIIPGGTSLTDNRLANVAAGEMILNQRQQDNLFKAIDQDKLGSGGSKVEVTGVLRGKDLLLVQKNYNTTASRGQKIRIN